MHLATETNDTLLTQILLANLEICNPINAFKQTPIQVAISRNAINWRTGIGSNSTGKSSKIKNHIQFDFSIIQINKFLLFIFYFILFLATFIRIK